MLWIVALLLVLNSTASIELKNRALAHAAHVAQAQAQATQAQQPGTGYVVCNCTNVEWNRSVETWSYQPDHPNLSVEYH